MQSENDVAPSGSHGYVSSIGGPNGIDPPKMGETILVLKHFFLNKILSGEKTLELNHKPMRSKRYWLGASQKIYGSVEIGAPIQIRTEERFAELRPLHLVDGQSMYRYRLPTWGLPLKNVLEIEPIAYQHPVGAIRFVLFRPADRQPPLGNGGSAKGRAKSRAQTLKRRPAATHRTRLASNNVGTDSEDVMGSDSSVGKSSEEKDALHGRSDRAHISLD